MRIEIATNNDKDRWNGFLNSSENGSFYHLFEWKGIYENSFKHETFYLMAMDESNEIKGIFPLVLVKGIFFGKLAVSVPFLNYGGFCTINEEAWGALFEKAVDIVKIHKAKYLEIRSINRYGFDLPIKTHKVSMTLPLNPDPETLWNKFSSKQRQTIRKGTKNGLEFKFGRKELLRDFYEVLCRGWRDLGTPIYHFSFFENIVDTFGDSIEIYLVMYEGKPIATALVGFFKKTVEGMWLATLKDFAKLQTNYFQYWEMVKRACERGYELFHFGRSTVESGGQFFKEKWNAVPTPLYWYYHLNAMKNLPELNKENPKYDFPIKIWQQLPLWMTKIIGPPIAKGIP